MDTVPQSFRLGRESIRHSTVQAVEVDPEETFKVTKTVEEEKPSDVDTLQDSLGSINTISDIFMTYSDYM